MSYPSQGEDGDGPALDNLLAEAEPGLVVESELEDLIEDMVKSGQGLQMVQPDSVSGVEYSRLGMLGGPHQRLEPLLITVDETAEHFPQYQHGGVRARAHAVGGDGSAG